MTTIATDGKSMAGDGLGTSNTTISQMTERKVRRLCDGRIAGFSGVCSAAKPFIKWLERGEQGDPPKADENFHVLVLATDGTARIFFNDGNSDPVDLPAVLGSGGDLALGAMLAGASPERAVQIAASRNVWTGGKITVEHIKGEV